MADGYTFRYGRSGVGLAGIQTGADAAIARMALTGPGGRDAQSPAAPQPNQGVGGGVAEDGDELLDGAGRRRNSTHRPVDGSRSSSVPHRGQPIRIRPDGVTRR